MRTQPLKPYSRFRDAHGHTITLGDRVRLVSAGQVIFATVRRVLLPQDPANPTGYLALALQGPRGARTLIPARLVHLAA